ncbi:uncharacterized protein CcaverHIS019_0400410 [Cutaneotrichosporon cavernicola]|uniref:P-loop containing nucleoside triphosphate hydrolase protein n=1 Tax=Cutaneotrichosporon cavernicola TaxID=279322 RepID=A0AA48L3D6_9TREE|nr:uncharacterized protein CcaverHIS019_0400410 [Cutaneotrichosporon cavernicola]BEI91221.1 hypothetical protein CcaverHIS019_0400410 [Cutaneotrichosporon cavernicola]
MYHLFKGLHTYLTRKDEYSVVIIGLDNAGKTTMLEQIKTLYNPTPGMPPDKIGPTVGQNIGKISLPSTTMHFFDLGGQRDIRSIWPRYYDECHAVVFVLDASDQARLSETWEVFDEVLNSPRLLNLPLLLLANKQDKDTSLTVAEVPVPDSPLSATIELPDEDKAQRMASLDVLGGSALEGTGVREAIDWLYIRVQNSRQVDDDGRF